MPLTQLDESSALILIDLQKGVVGLPMADSTSDVVQRAARLVHGFHERGMPVVVVNVTGMAPGRTDAGSFRPELPPDWTELVPELEFLPGDHHVSKQRWGAFLGTDLQDFLQSRGITQVVIAGIATSVGVESTARCAYDLGYHVALVLDAMTDRDADAHRHCQEKIFPRIGETTTTEEVLNVLKGTVE